MTEAATGYLHAQYADSLAEFGTACLLPRSGGWILQRQIGGSPDRDAMGCYPVFVCRDWPQLPADLDEISDQIVALSVVTDPFGEYTLGFLKRCFRDIVTPYKEHFVIDLRRPLSTYVSDHHRRYAKKALRELYVEKIDHPGRFYGDWLELYASLIERHKIRGLTEFSRLAFQRQFSVPGLVAFRAVYDDKTVGMLLWYVQDDLAYYHLGAYSSVGYQSRASFGLFWCAIEYFSGMGLKYLNLGSGAGVRSDGHDGLSSFKRGWSTGTRTAYLCGRIFNLAKYTSHARARGMEQADYFPAYRKGEFT